MPGPTMAAGETVASFRSKVMVGIMVPVRISCSLYSRNYRRNYDACVVKQGPGDTNLSE